MFHALAECCADEFVGRNKRGEPGWVRTYRALNHRQAEEACRGRDIRSLPDDVRDFANLFVALQDERHRADYDPIATFYKSDVERLIVYARAVLEQFENADRAERRSFAAFALFRRRD